MIDLEKDLIKEIRYSFPLELKEWKRIKLLMESQHVPDIAEECVNRISEWIADFYFKNKGTLKPDMEIAGMKKYIFKLPVALCRDIENVFFYSLDGIVELNIYSNDIGVYNSGGYNESDYGSLVYDDNKKLVLRKISFNINCFTHEYNIKGSVYGALIHEFNHAYEDYNRMLNNKTLTYKDWLDKTKYRILFKPHTNHTIVNYLLNGILYHLSPTEINATISQSYGELKFYNFTNTNDAVEKIKNTQAYKSFGSTIEWFQELKNITDNKEQNEAVRYYNEIRNKNIKDFKQLIDILQNEIDCTKMHIFKNISKSLTK